MALTDTEIKKAKPKEKAYRMSDSGGMYLWVTPSGGKLWQWAYRFGGKEKLMSFGKYPAVSLALARERHSDARKLLATGVDPMAQRKAEKTAVQCCRSRIGPPRKFKIDAEIAKATSHFGGRWKPFRSECWALL